MSAIRTPRNSTGWRIGAPLARSSSPHRLTGLYLALGLGLLALSVASCAESGPGEAGCLGADDCGEGESCVNNTCVSDEVDALDDALLDAEEDAPDETDGLHVDAIDDIEVDELGEQGDPCDNDAECTSDICLPTNNNTGRRGICTEACHSDGECAEQYICRVLSRGGPDVEEICVPQSQILCDQCSEDFDCGQLGQNFCQELVNGDFCLINCEETRRCPDPNPNDDDPNPYECNAVTIEGGSSDGEDLDTFLCFPRNDVCHPIRLVGGAFVSTPTVIRAPRNAPVQYRLSGYITSTPGVVQGGTFRLSGGL